MTEKLPVAGPSITEIEIAAVSDAIRNCWYTQAGKYEAEFEKAFADYIGVEYAACMNSCTAALHLSLLALGLKEGDEVIVPDVTWIASAAPINYVGAKPVFCDIDRKTWCLDVESVSQAITEKTRAIIAVDLYGSMPDWEGLVDVARQRNIPIIEDAAEALGSEYQMQKAGSFGITGTFSFHGSKTLTTGEGGMFVTDDRDIFERIQFLRDHGRRPGDVTFRNEEVAYKYKMSGLQAALGNAQLTRVEELVGKKRQIYKWYQEFLGQFEGIQLNAEPEGVRNSYWMSSVIIDRKFGLNKHEVIEQLRGNYGIDARPFFSPLSSLPAYREQVSQAEWERLNPVSYEIGEYGLNLPSALILEREDIKAVAESLVHCLSKGGAS